MKKYLIIIVCLLLTTLSIAQTKDDVITSDMWITTTEVYENLTISSDATVYIESTGYLKVNGELTNNGNEKNLIIEPGGQLMVHNPVMATFKQRINAFNQGDNSGWYTLCPPMIDQHIIKSDLCNDQTVGNDYDIYYYNESNAYWIEYEAGEDVDGLYEENNIPNTTGRGFLYANVTGGDFAYKGHLYSADVEVHPTRLNEDELAGFNLLGNPFSHDIYKGKDGNAICGFSSQYMATGYYTMTGDGIWKAHSYTEPIKPGQGFLVKLNSEINELRIYNKDDKPITETKNDNNKLKLVVSGDYGEDVVFVYFSDGIGLDKINHKSEMAPYLCVKYDNKKYAIAHVNNDCRALNMIFRNNQAGFFTLKVEDGLSDFSYLHVIDNITGEDIDLLMEPSYKFAANGNEYESRFKLVFAPNSNDGVDNATFAYISNNDIIITGVKDKATLQVYDITGRVISSDIISGTEGSVCRVAKPNVVGVYVLRLIESNNVNTQKIVIE